MKISSFSFQALAIFVASVLLASPLFTVLPTVFNDEYIYSMQARHADEYVTTFGNYFFNLLFSATSLCGDNFYGCGKVLNFLLLFALGMFLLGISRTLHEPRISMLFALGGVALPFIVNVSFFTPEILFGALVTASFLLAVQLFDSRDISSGRFRILVVALILTQVLLLFTKPHGLVFSLALAVLILFTGSRGIGARILESIVLVILPIALRIGIGFVIDGSRGANLLGESYFTTVMNLLQKLTPQYALAAPLGSLEVVSTSGGTSLGMSIGSVLLINASAFVVLLVPFYVHRIPQFGALEQRRSRQLLDIYVFLWIPVTIGFAALVTASGDSHVDRPLMRYIEHVLPLLFVFSFGRLQRLPRLPVIRVVLLMLAMVAVVLSSVNLWGDQIDVADSTFIFSLQSMPFGYAVLLFPFALVAIANWRKQDTVRQYWAYAISYPLLLITISIAGVGQMVTNNSGVAFWDSAGLDAHQILQSDKDGTSSWIVVTPNKTIGEGAAFWIDSPQTRVELASSAVILPSPCESNYVVLTQDLLPQTALGYEQHLSDGYGLYVCNSPEN